MKTIKSKKEFMNLLKRIHENGIGVEEQATPPVTPAAGVAAAPPTAGAVEQEPITLDDIIEKLNIIRSGRSTKDDDVKSELENYILQFSEEDKSSLLAFLDGLGRILTSEDENAQAQTGAPAAPGTPPAPAAAPPVATTQKPAPQKSSATPINAGGI